MANGWDTAALAARMKENPELGFDPKGIGSLTNGVTQIEIVQRNIQREHDLQTEAFEEFGKIALVYPDYRMIHPVPNGQYRAGQRPEAGLSFGAGYPDISWDLPRLSEGGQFYFGLRCELKVGKNTLSEAQEWWRDRLVAKGYYWIAIWDDLGKILDTFEWYYNLGEIKQ